MADGIMSPEMQELLSGKYQAPAVNPLTPIPEATAAAAPNINVNVTSSPDLSFLYGTPLTAPPTVQTNPTSSAALPDVAMVGGGLEQMTTAPEITAATTDQSNAVYKPRAPQLTQTGLGTMQRLMQMLHRPEPGPVSYPKQTSPLNQPLPSTEPDDASGGYGYDSTKDFLKQSNEFINDYDRVVGNGTTFGLDYSTGEPDVADPNPTTAFDYNAHTKDQEGASLPISVINNSIGDYQKNSHVFDAIKRGDYKVAVTNEDGSITKVVPLIDAGPADWTGNAIDLTYKTAHDLNTGGKAKVGFQLIGPDGDIVPIRGFHQKTVQGTNWDDHIGPARKAIQPAEPAEPAKPAQPGQPETEATKKPQPPIKGTEAEKIPTEEQLPPNDNKPYKGLLKFKDGSTPVDNATARMAMQFPKLYKVDPATMNLQQ